MTSYIGLLATVGNKKIEKCTKEIGTALDKLKLFKKYDKETVMQSLENIQTLLDSQELSVSKDSDNQ